MQVSLCSSHGLWLYGAHSDTSPFELLFFSLCTGFGANSNGRNAAVNHRGELAFREPSVKQGQHPKCHAIRLKDCLLPCLHTTSASELQSEQTTLYNTLGVADERVIGDRLLLCME